MSDARRFVELEEPRFEMAPAMEISGLPDRYELNRIEGVDGHWRRFFERIGSLGLKKSEPYFGAYRNFDDSGFEYVPGIEVVEGEHLPGDFVTISFPEQLYAVFSHHGDVRDMGRTHYTIWHKWLPESDYVPTYTPCFEKYDERTDLETGERITEIWIPVHEKIDGEK